MKIEIKKLHDDVKIPTRGSAFAAGYDLYAYFGDTVTMNKNEYPSIHHIKMDNLADKKSINIPPHTTAMIGTGISIAIPDGYFGAIYARSGLASKRGLRPANCVGVIDSDYRGEIVVPLFNDTEFGTKIEMHERIAQIIIQKFENIEFKMTNNLSSTERGDGGFGSTGSKS